MTKSFLERIHQAGSTKPVRRKLSHSERRRGQGGGGAAADEEEGDGDGNGNVGGDSEMGIDGSLGGGVPITFENLNVVDETSSQPRQRRKRTRSLGLGRTPSNMELSISGHQQQQRGQSSTTNPMVYTEPQIRDHDGELFLPMKLASSNGGNNDLDRSDRTGSESFQIGSYSDTSAFSRIFMPNRTNLLAIVIATAGLIASTLFLGLGISHAVEEQEELFTVRAESLVFELKQAWEEYHVAALWIYEASILQSRSRENFSEIYEYAKSYVNVEAVYWIPKVMDEDRETLEAESMNYFQTNYPNIVDYKGITELTIPGKDAIIDPLNASVHPRGDHPYYYPIHRIEPINPRTIFSIELDLLGSELHAPALEEALKEYRPSVTAAYHRIQPTGDESIDDIYLDLLHPGIPVSVQPDRKPRDLVGLEVRIKALIEKITINLPESLSMFIYDSTDSDTTPEFLIAAEMYNDQRIIYLEKVALSTLRAKTVFFMKEHTVEIESRTWTIALIALENTFEPEFFSVLLAGKFIMIASFCTALWIVTSFRRTRTVLEVKRAADMEKARVIVRTAREKAKAEQELNDYIAHEVRNPLAAALSAVTFVKSTINGEIPSCIHETLEAIREDVEIIDSSLTYTHDLLRSMLDMHRAANRKLAVHEAPLDVLHDLLEPVVSMVPQRSAPFRLLTECPEGLFVVSDRLRLKQILLNLCRNSARYVSKGYVKVGAGVVDGRVQFFVEDSGHGISKAARKKLFSKFQESLEVMDQGSGVGLCLCKSMAGVLNGDIWLDEDFDSGVQGFPGSRFIIGLDKEPIFEQEVKKMVERWADTSGPTLPTHQDTDTSEESSNVVLTPVVEEKTPIVAKKAASVEFLAFPNENGGQRSSLREPPSTNIVVDTLTEETFDLPANVSVLFVDDDMILRKLFMRSVRNVMSTWNIQEAASGEAALKLTDEKEFDIIFMDQYMASVEKKLLGTETVHALRSKGVQSRICGLSANDVEEGFLRNGADTFMFKPFPCKKEDLRRELHRIWYSTRPRERSETYSSSDQTAEVV